MTQTSMIRFLWLFRLFESGTPPRMAKGDKEGPNCSARCPKTWWPLKRDLTTQLTYSVLSIVLEYVFRCSIVSTWFSIVLNSKIWNSPMIFPGFPNLHMIFHRFPVIFHGFHGIFTDFRWIPSGSHAIFDGGTSLSLVSAGTCQSCPTLGAWRSVDYLYL